MASTDKIVSSDDETLILVDADDRETGFLDKARCHDGAGVLHRAFSVFLFNDAGQLLLQQRAPGKRLWPNFWSNSCCSHPRKGESMAEATLRRIEEELGIRANVEFVYKFSYQAQYGDEGAEHELCWVFLGRSNDAVKVNSNEIAAFRYVQAQELSAELAADSAMFTPWLRMEWQRLQEEFSGRLAVYTTSVKDKAS
ncbi:MAG: isopentenyl-diphosphate Delta-isomerase [Woeseia sp.]|nr:isopentenyl-diphosphate Delta-isomerase [Woeseia sp.]MBT8095812.1 isopentenyl-diphosphate Delta-isomerase [Woeseia sp.]NNE61738.1 isopentenyl-diphosphate Delta-isomerase [Woeseia sp.]NNL54151.1 isopentenyl-diphosphate Delta-isomerase [Woeseia sp.]